MSKLIIGVWPNLSVEISGDDTFEILKELAFWDSVPHECPVGDCGAPLHFTYREPVAKQGPNKGKAFPYAGLQCLGNPSHECQFSKRNDDSGSIFLREGNRVDGQPNWRLAYKVRDDEEPPYEAPGRDREPQQPEPAHITELVKLGKEKGYPNEKALNVNCRHIYNKDIRQLFDAEAREYYKTLRDL